MSTVTLPDGASADLRDDINKAPRFLMREISAVEMRIAALPSLAAKFAARVAGDTEKVSADISDIVDAGGLIEELNAAQILAAVISWSFGPVTAEILDRIPSDAFELLAAEAEKRTPKTTAPTRAELADPTQPPVDSTASDK